MPEPYGPYEIDDERWALMQEAMDLKLKEVGKPGDFGEFLAQLKIWYLMYDDIPAMQMYIASQKLPVLIEQKTAQESVSDALDAEIAALQAILNQ